MRRLILTALLLGLPGIARSAEPRKLEIEDLFRIQRVSDPQLSPDGRTVAYVVGVPIKAENRTDTDIWLAAADGSGVPRKLTQSPKHDRHPRWSPDGSQIVFESNRGGSFQLYILPVDGGEPRQLTTLSTEANQPVWSPDGRSIAFVSAVFPEFSNKPFKESDELNRKKLDGRESSKVKARVIDRLLYRHWDSWVDDRRQHIFVVPAAGGEPRNLTPGDRDAVPTSSTFSAGVDFAFSPDSSELAYTATPEPAREEAWKTDHNLYTVQLSTGERRQLTTNPAADAFPRYSPDGRYLAYRAQTRPGYEADRWELILLERATGVRRSVTSRFDSWVEAFVWSPDSQSIYFEAEERGRKPIWRLAVADGSITKVVDGGVCGEPQVSPDGRYLVYTRQNLTRATEVFRSPVGGGAFDRVTRVGDAVFNAVQMSIPESVTYKGDGGVPIQMWLIKPPGFDPARKYPLVFWVHGGPQGAFMDSWSFRWNAQLWAAQGYVLALPNPRGSTGFGQRFVEGVSRDWGGKVYRDLLKGIAFVEALPYVDKSRMAAAGASFGGYMMNWFQANGNPFRTLVTHCGVYNFHSMYGATEEVWFDEWEHGIPWQTRDFDRFSPHRFAGKFRTPNLIIHNELDFRVPINEGLNLFTTLQRQGVPSRLLYFPDEGHWVLKPLNSELWHKTIFDWLGNYLR